MSDIQLSGKHCAPCNGQLPALSRTDIDHCLNQLHVDWRLSQNATSIERRFVFAGFAKAAYLANLCAWLADKEGHHPDISFGWGYCAVVLTTHDADGLTENDFLWAAQLDTLVS